MKKPVVIILLSLAALFVLAGIAAVFFFAFVSDINGFGRASIAATAEESKSLKVDAEKIITLKVIDDAGDVTIVGADVDTVSVEVVKTAYGTTQANAEGALKKIKYDIKQTGNTITLRHTVPNVRTNVPVNVIGVNWDIVDFIVTVPSEALVDVDAGYGEVNVSDTHGNVKILNDFGDITLKNIQGKVIVDTESGQVDASSISAGEETIELSSGFGKIILEKASSKDVRLDSNSGNLEMNEVRASGNVTMSTDFGNINFSSGSANSLNIDTQSGKITFTKLTLQSTLMAKSEFGEISVEQVKAASYDLQTNSGSITADGVFGNVKAHSGFGSVTVKNGASVTIDLSTQSGSVDFEGSLGDGTHSIYSEFGDINLTIPADSALNVDLKTDFGSIKSDIPITVVLSGDSDGEENHQTGTMNDGGAQLTVETQSGNISILASKR